MNDRQHQQITALLDAERHRATSSELARMILDQPTPPPAISDAERAELARKFFSTPVHLTVLPPDPEIGDTRRARNQHRLENWCWTAIGFAFGFAAAALALGAATTPY